MNEEISREINTESPKNRASAIIKTQLICVLIILAMLCTVKYFFADYFTEIKKYYLDNICDDTDVNEVIKADGDSNEI